MAKRARDTRVKRGRISDPVRCALWARCAGRCTICNRSLLGDSRTFLHTVLAGQLAHNVGATGTAGSPRGSAEYAGDREAEENLLLLCNDCHRIVDHPAFVHLYPTEKLRALKDQHEARIEKVTGNGGLKRTAAIRVGSNVRGSFAMAPKHDVGEVLIEEDYLALVESQWSGDFTCRIQGDETDRAYWAGAQDAIDKSLNTVRQAIEQQDIEHVSVFSIAPIPVLVYLGSALDDKIPTRLYQRSRDASIGWRWNGNAPVIDFQHSATASDTEDVVLTCGLSAPVDPSRLPPALQAASRFDMTPQGVAPSPTLVANEATLFRFADAWRVMLAEVERTNPQSKRWHLVAAVPVSVAVEIGRSFMREAQPPVAVYQRTDSTYIHALEVNA